MYTTARYILGWSEDEFWKACPKKYFAVLFKLGKIKSSLFPAENKQEVLVGRNALKALSYIAQKTR